MSKHVLEAKPVSGNGLFELAVTNPVEPAFGAGDPHGKAKTCQLFD